MKERTVGDGVDGSRIVATRAGTTGLDSLVTGHWLGCKESHGGPDHQSADMARSGARTPLLARSAGLDEVGTCLHVTSGRSSWMAWTRLATKRSS